MPSDYAHWHADQRELDDLFAATPPKPGLTRPSWAQVREEHEFFDGEVEIEAAAKRAWKQGRYDR